MLQIKHMLAAAVTAFMAGNQATSMPDLDVQRMDTRSTRVPARTGTE